MICLPFYLGYTEISTLYRIEQRYLGTMMYALCSDVNSISLCERKCKLAFGVGQKMLLEPKIH